MNAYMFKDIRIGQGFDVHPFIVGRPLRLGGIEVPHSKGLKGHSDADALLHAITDAILGALGKGDIGELFPDTDPEFKDADSRELLKKVARLAQDDGWRVVNIDSTIVTESPKIAPYKQTIAKSISQILSIEPSSVGVKATTCEKMGFIGREEGLLALANVLLVKDK